MAAPARNLTNPVDFRNLSHAVVRLGLFAMAGGIGGALGAVLAAPATAGGGRMLFDLALAKFTELTPGHFAGLVTNNLANKLSAHLADRWANPGDASAEASLKACMGRTIGRCLRELARDKQRIRAAADRDALGRLAANAPRLWARIARFPGTAKWSAQDLRSALDTHIESLIQQGGGARPVDAASWELVLERMLRNSRDLELSAAAHAAAAQHLETNTAQQFLDQLTRDAAAGGQGLAAALFASLAELRHDLPKSVAAAVTSTVEGQLSAWDDDARWRHRAVIRRIGKVDEALTDGLVGLHAALTPALPLDERQPDATPIQSLSRILRAQQRAIPLIGRDEEQDALEDWLVADELVSLRLITGLAGTGKTRLAQELCDVARENGWHAGFLSREGLDDFLKEHTRNWNQRQKTLVVLDYAAARTQQIERFFGVVERHVGEVPRRPPLRILLLERQRGADGEGLARLLDNLALQSHQARNHWYYRTHDVKLEGLQRKPEALHETLVASAAMLGIDDFDARRLADALPSLRLDEATPLLLQLAVRFRKGIVDPDIIKDADRIDSLGELLGRWWKEERRIIQRIASAARIPEKQVLVMVVLCCLRGGLPKGARKLQDLAQSESSRWGLGSVTSGDDLCRVLEGYLGKLESSDITELAPLEPDLMAEYAVLDWFREHGRSTEDKAYLLDWIAAAATERPSQVGAFLVRLCQDLFDDPAWKFLEDEDWWRVVPGEMIVGAEAVLPMHSTALRTLSASIGKALLEKAAEDDWPERARRRNNLGVRFSNLGRREEALQATQDAVDIYRQLAQAHSGEFKAELAGALSNLGNRLSGLGRLEEALLATKEGASLHQELADARPVEFEPGLAMALNNLGVRFSDLGRREEALHATQEAVDIYRRLAHAHPDAFEPNLAMALNNLGVRFSDLGRREEALHATQEAVDFYRRLAHAHPDAFEPDLAVALNNLGNQLSNLSRRADALQATQEAAELYSHLAQARLDVFGHDLAGVLNNLGVRLADVGRREEALHAALQAVDIRRQLIQSHPETFRPDLASALNNLGVIKSALDLGDEALQATDEAVHIYRRLAQAYPGAFERDLAMALNNLGNQLSNVGSHEEALHATQEAVDFYRQLARAHPDAFEPDLAGALNNLGVRLSKLGHREEALQATQEAVDIHRRLAQAHPDAFEPDLAMALNNLGVRFSDLGRREEALHARQEAVHIYRQLAHAHPDVFEPDLARSLGAMGSDLAQTDQRAATRCFADGLRVLLPHLRGAPAAFAGLARALARDLLGSCKQAGIEPDSRLLDGLAEVLDGQGL